MTAETAAEEPAEEETLETDVPDTPDSPASGLRLGSKGGDVADTPVAVSEEAIAVSSN